MNRTPIILLIAVVLIAGAATAWLFGWIAGEGYAVQIYPRTVSFARPIVIVGEGWGAFTGLIAGAIWCRIMVPKALRAPRRRWAGSGAVTGLAVGLLSTILLHAVLINVSNRMEPIVLIVGLVCGVVAGLIVGAICGGLCGAAARRARPESGRIEEAKPR